MPEPGASSYAIVTEAQIQITSELRAAEPIGNKRLHASPDQLAPTVAEHPFHFHIRERDQTVAVQPCMQGAGQKNAEQQSTVLLSPGGTGSAQTQQSQPITFTFTPANAGTLTTGWVFLTAGTQTFTVSLPPAQSSWMAAGSSGPVRPRYRRVERDRPIARLARRCETS